MVCNLGAIWAIWAIICLLLAACLLLLLLLLLRSRQLYLRGITFVYTTLL